jgi:lysophospholipase L1-like esterase
MTVVARVSAILVGILALVLGWPEAAGGGADRDLEALVRADATAAGLRPITAVALGDSAASGEGAGAYEVGTDGPDNYCHRSRHAYIHHVQPGFDVTVNLACFSVSSDHLRIGGLGKFGESSQLDRLAQLAVSHDVRLVTVQIGANDEPEFDDTIVECILRFAAIVGPGCKDTIGPEWTERLQAMGPKVTRVLLDVHTVMDAAGYAQGDYDVVLLSYASPVTEQMRPVTHAWRCPIRQDDARWGRTIATVELADTLRESARTAGSRYLDLSRSMEGRESCHRDLPAGGAWVRALAVRPDGVMSGIGPHVVQESFHPNARGHEQIGRCLSQFYRSGAQEAMCLKDAAGDLTPVDDPGVRF